MNQHRHLPGVSGSDNRIPGRANIGQSPAPFGGLLGNGPLAQAMAKERNYQQNWAAFQSLQQQLQAMQSQPGGPVEQNMNPLWQQIAMRNRMGYREPGRLRPSEFSSFGDMFDGGGAGQSGNTFAGGGLLSVLGNLTGTKPRGQS